MLGRGLLLFEFEPLFEAEWVLTMGKRRVKESLLHLEKWNLTMRCFHNMLIRMCFHKGAYANKNSMLGLLHLWSGEVFKKAGGCGGYIVV